MIRQGLKVNLNSEGAPRARKIKKKENSVKKTPLAVALALFFAVTPVMAQDDAAVPQAVNPVEQFTGEYWTKSTPTEKEAYLFGIESAVAVEKSISDLPAKGKRGKTVTSLSPFEKGWMTAFRDTPRKQIVKEVDDWYAANPSKMSRPVLDVIWYDVIVPRLNKAG